MKKWLLVGLGNPTQQYQFTRHNAGFLCLDLLAVNASVHWKRAFGGLWGQGEVFCHSCYFLKPHIYMNESGISVVAAMNYYKIEAASVIVLHDDLDVPAGTVKARIGGNAGGHNGVQSVIDHLHSRAFHRIKLGIAKQGEASGKSWVLGKFSALELEDLRTTVMEQVLVRLKQIFQQTSGS